MVAHTRLWIEDNGQLTDAPPSRGVLLAPNGGDIPARFVERYHLSVVDGKVVQKGKPAKTPKSTPDPLIADRDLWVTSEGAVVEEKPSEGGNKIATNGEKISRGYVTMHNLISSDGKIVQKSIAKPKDKMMRRPPNK